jgi:hypothetical protein
MHQHGPDANGPKQNKVCDNTRLEVLYNISCKAWRGGEVVAAGIHWMVVWRIMALSKKHVVVEYHTSKHPSNT